MAVPSVKYLLDDMSRPINAAADVLVKFPSSGQIEVQSNSISIAFLYAVTATGETILELIPRTNVAATNDAVDIYMQDTTNGSASGSTIFFGFSRDTAFVLNSDQFGGDSVLPFSIRMAGTEKVRITQDGGIYIEDGVSTPATITGKAVLFVDSADGDLKVKFGDGTVRLIVAD